MTPARPPKSTILFARVTPATVRAVEADARRLRLTRSEWLRRAINLALTENGARR